MPYIVPYPTADIVRYLLVLYQVGTDPEDTDHWPVYVSKEPDKPDNAITVYTTSGVTEGRLHPTGEVPEHHGVMIRVRGATYLEAWYKIWSIIKVLDESVYREQVYFEDQLFLVHCANRSGSANYLGSPRDNSERELFTVNYTITLGN